ncbi:MAG: MoaD/ThiS family protein [SAR202 cluster bacterium]|nr:MoaD/ThiS family protein [SAR202 cluster bacterium]
MAKVFIPSLMQSLTKGKGELQVPGKTIREIINNLEQQYPGMKARLVDGFRIKGNINVAIDGEVTPLGLLAEVNEDSEVHFLPAIGGGSLPG